MPGRAASRAGISARPQTAPAAVIASPIARTIDRRANAGLQREIGVEDPHQRGVEGQPEIDRFAECGADPAARLSPPTHGSARCPRLPKRHSSSR